MTKLFLKRFILAFLVFAALCLPGVVYAQNLSLELKNVTVQEAITRLQSQGTYTVVILSDDVDLQKRVSVSAKNATLSEVLDQIFKGQDIEYTINGSAVSVNHRKKTVTNNPKANSNVKPNTNTSFRGIILDNVGEALIGAAVIDKKSGNYALTNESGAFSINGLTFPSEITISYLGYDDRTVTLTGRERQPFTIVMEGGNNMLDELVVVGYGTQKKINLTGAVSVIDGRELNFRPVSNTAMAIQGADPSLVLTTTSGSIDGSNYDINIRGKLSINSGSPLILVDGIESSLTQVNPNDIESISVLKDASACAIYGAKASAGVVLITTKSGSAGEAKLSYNGRVSVSQNTTSTDFMTTGYDYVTLCNEFYTTIKGYGAWTYSNEQLQMLYDRRNDKVENPSRPWVVPDVTGTNTYVYLGNFDWYNYLFNTTRPETEHNFSVRGGTDKVRYYASGRYLWRKGLIGAETEDIYNNYSLRNKIEAKMTKWLDYSSNISFDKNQYAWGGFPELDGSTGYSSQGIILNSSQNVGPNLVPVNPDGSVVYLPGFLADATSPLMGGRGGHFVDGRTHNVNRQNYWTWTNRFTAHIIDGLDFVADYTYKRRDRDAEFRDLPIERAYDNVNKRFYTKDLFVGKDSTREIRYSQDANIINGYFSYSKAFGSHNFSATLGGNYDDYHSTQLTVRQVGSLSETLSYINLTNGVIDQAIQANSAYRTLGFFGRVNYDWKGRYLLEVSGRYDGTSRFPKGHRWGFFPSASAGWRLSEEPFWAPIKPIISSAKIRASYGSLGNQQVSNYYYWETISTGVLGTTYDGVNKAGYASISAPVSSSLTWETVISKNLGLDLAFLNNRLSLSADFYVRDTKNMLTEAMALPVVYGENAPKENAADLRTKGYELSINWKDNFIIAGKPMYYDLTASLGDFVTHITRFNNEQKLLSKNYEGKRLGDIWGYETDGVFATDEEAAAYESSIQSFSTANYYISIMAAPWNHLMSGDIKYVDRNNDGKIDTGNNTLDDHGDLKIIGNSLPRYNYAFKGNFNWAGLDLSFFFQGVGKINWYPNGDNTYFWGPYTFQRSAFIPVDFNEKCWSAEPGADNSNIVYPRKRSCIAKPARMKTNDFFMYNSAYLRLKNLTIGYTLPIRKQVLEKARIYISGENLFYLSPLKKVTKYIDPEVATTSAYADALYPYSKTFSFGIDITF